LAADPPAGSSLVQGDAGRNDFALAALILGIMGVPFFWLAGILPLAAFVVGLISFVQIRRLGGSQAGRSKALAGIVLGAIGLLLIPTAYFVVIAVGRWCAAGRCLAF
jgi:hypothetical protein